MKTRNWILGVIGAGAMSVAGCGGGAGASATDAGTSATDAGTRSTADNISAVCGQMRRLSCPSTDTCEGEIGMAIAGYSASCRAAFERYLACGATSTGNTCEGLQQGRYNGCTSGLAAVMACIGAQDAGGPTDAPTTASVPAPSEFTLTDNATITWTREGQTPQVGMGMAGIGVTPLGAPANGHQFVMSNANVPTGSHTLSCGVGFVYADGAYTFSNHTVLTQPCEVRGVDDSVAGTLTWTGGAVSLAPAGNPVVTLNATLAGDLGTGPVTVTVVFPPR